MNPFLEAALLQGGGQILGSLLNPPRAQLPQKRRRLGKRMQDYAPALERYIRSQYGGRR